MRHKIEQLLPSAISPEDLAQLAALSCAIFPSPAKTPDSVVERLQNALHENSSGEEARRCYVVRENGCIVASASITPRWIGSSRGLIYVAGLCSVMCDAAQRGRGMGKAVVRRAFETVDAGEFEWALFQTNEAREFYEKLGCCVVENRIVNSHNTDSPEANPLWEPWAMRYPCKAGWPEGTIDLLGPAY